MTCLYHFLPSDSLQANGVMLSEIHKLHRPCPTGEELNIIRGFIGGARGHLPWGSTHSVRFYPGCCGSSCGSSRSQGGIRRVNLQPLMLVFIDWFDEFWVALHGWEELKRKNRDATKKANCEAEIPFVSWCKHHIWFRIYVRWSASKTPNY